MAKRPGKQQAGTRSPVASAVLRSEPATALAALLGKGWIPLVLAVIAFLVYGPSLRSDFVYDGRLEVDEGFFTSLSNLPLVLSFKVLGLNLILGSRPGQLLYLMLIAAVCGQAPLGYHLCSNLLHASNVGLLYVLLSRLLAAETMGLEQKSLWKIRLAITAVTLVFALHPLAVEAVSVISYSSDLLVTFFALLALLAATAFRVDRPRVALLAGGLGTFCAFAAVTCKESGLAVAALLIVYWFLFRRREAVEPWFLFLGAAVVVTGGFLTARFLCAPPEPGGGGLGYLGGSLSQVFINQPRLWVFMMGKIVWPLGLSADYVVENVSGLSVVAGGVILGVVVLLQAWLAVKSRLGALGVAIYWLGLVTVSNFMPLHRVVADRFYYLPLVGVAFQILALLLMPKARVVFWPALGVLAVALLVFGGLNLNRQEVFVDDFSLWSGTVAASPSSAKAHLNLGVTLSRMHRMNEAIVEYQKAMVLDPRFPEVYANLAAVMMDQGRVKEAIPLYQKAIALRPGFVDAYLNMGIALIQMGRLDDAIATCQQAAVLNPYNALIQANLGVALSQKGQAGPAIAAFHRAIELDPKIPQAHNGLGATYLNQGQMEQGIAEVREALRLWPEYPDAQRNLAKALEEQRSKGGSGK